MYASQVRFRDTILKSRLEIHPCRKIRFKNAPRSFTNYRNLRKFSEDRPPQVDMFKMIGYIPHRSVSGMLFQTTKLFCLQREQLLRSQFFGTVSFVIFVIASKHSSSAIQLLPGHVSSRGSTGRYRVIPQACRHGRSTVTAGKTRSQIEIPSCAADVFGPSPAISTSARRTAAMFVSTINTANIVIGLVTP
jgi:hypothetical protein